MCTSCRLLSALMVFILPACRHLAAAEGCYSVVQWLVEDMGADPNPIDRFGRTPLEDAVRLWLRCSSSLRQSHAATWAA